MGGYLFLCQIGGGGAYHSFIALPVHVSPFPQVRSTVPAAFVGSKPGGQ